MNSSSYKTRENAMNSSAYKTRESAMKSFSTEGEPSAPTTTARRATPRRATARRRRRRRDDDEMVFWDSPRRADDDARSARARCDGEDINRRATATTRARAWLRDALERGPARATGGTGTLVLDDAAREAREATVGAANEEELKHLRRHVDALTRECADAVARANAGAIAREKFEQLRRENAALKNADALCKKAETRAKAAEARANAARDAMVSAKLRHEAALKKAYEEKDGVVERMRIDIEMLRSELACVEAKVSTLENQNAEMEEDLNEYREETAHLDEIIAQAESEMVRMLEEKRAIERELAAKSAMNIKSLIMSPFSPSSGSPLGTPRLAAAMRWFDTAVVSPMRSPFADITSADDAEDDIIGAKTPTARKSRLGPGMSPLLKTPGAVVEDSAEDVEKYESDNESVGVETVRERTCEVKRWRLVLSKVPESRLYGRRWSDVGVRLRVVGAVSLSNLASAAST